MPWKIRRLHDWDLAPGEAIALQQKLRDRVETRDRLRRPRLVAGVDVGVGRRRRRAHAAVAVLSFPALELVARATATLPLAFPYVPGLLSFRELPAAIAALQKLHRPPDLILCDGQGLAHPRRFGLACHLGLVLDRPTVGVAKSRLIGSHAEPGPERGDRAPLLDGDEVIGTVLRTRARVRPLYVSIGHRVSLATAEELTLACSPRYRLPETTRWAHRLAAGSEGNA